MDLPQYVIFIVKKDKVFVNTKVVGVPYRVGQSLKKILRGH
jgi:hypothetical protein